MFEQSKDSLQSSSVVEMLSRLEGRVSRGRVEKNEAEKAISVVSKGVAKAKQVVSAQFDQMSAEQIADLSNAWKAFSEDGILKGDENKDLRVKLQKLLDEGAGMSPDLKRFTRQIWRTEMVAYLVEKVRASGKSDKGVIIEKMMASQIVGEKEDDPIEALTLAMHLDKAIYGKTVRQELAGKMSKSEKNGGVADLATLFPDKISGTDGLKIRIVVGGGLLEIPLEVADSLRFKKLVVDGERIYGQMENGCKGNLVIIDFVKSGAVVSQPAKDKVPGVVRRGVKDRVSPVQGPSEVVERMSLEQAEAYLTDRFNKFIFADGWRTRFDYSVLPDNLKDAPFYYLDNDLKDLVFATGPNGQHEVFEIGFNMDYVIGGMFPKDYNREKIRDFLNKKWVEVMLMLMKPPVNGGEESKSPELHDGIPSLAVPPDSTTPPVVAPVEDKETESSQWPQYLDGLYGLVIDKTFQRAPSSREDVKTNGPFYINQDGDLVYLAGGRYDYEVPIYKKDGLNFPYGLKADDVVKGLNERWLLAQVVVPVVPSEPAVPPVEPSEPEVPPVEPSDLTRDLSDDGPVVPPPAPSPEVKEEVKEVEKTPLTVNCYLNLLFSTTSLLQLPLLLLLLPCFSIPQNLSTAP